MAPKNHVGILNDAVICYCFLFYLSGRKRFLDVSGKWLSGKLKLVSSI